jgi:hypothetical protein
VPQKIPDIVGKRLANAMRALKNAGFEVGKVTQQTSSNKKGTVIAQSPDAGRSARPGRAVSSSLPSPRASCSSHHGCSQPADLRSASERGVERR